MSDSAAAHLDDPWRELFDRRREAQELLLIGPSCEPDECDRRNLAQPSEHGLHVPPLVEHVGRDRKVEPLRPWLTPVAHLRAELEPVPLGVLAQERDRILGPVRRDHRRPAGSRDERGDAEPAAELDEPEATHVRQRLGERGRRRPELGPVRQELVLRERVLVDQRLGRFGAQQVELHLPDPQPLLAEGSQSNASRPTVRPGGSEETRSTARSTPGTNASREVASWRIVSSSPAPPRSTSWCATSPGSRTE